MLIEAFACGVPVVASDSGEIPHVVADAGVIVGEQDADGWRESLAALIDSPSRRADLRARGLDRVRAEFAWPIIARRHLEFFEELLDR
jgi:glycosyltransferase involved in cell wall biosynthesis